MTVLVYSRSCDMIVMTPWYSRYIYLFLMVYTFLSCTCLFWNVLMVVCVCVCVCACVRACVRVCYLLVVMEWERYIINVKSCYGFKQIWLFKMTQHRQLEMAVSKKRLTQNVKQNSLKQRPSDKRRIMFNCHRSLYTVLSRMM